MDADNTRRDDTSRDDTSRDDTSRDAGNDDAGNDDAGHDDAGELTSAEVFTMWYDHHMGFPEGTSDPSIIADYDGSWFGLKRPSNDGPAD